MAALEVVVGSLQQPTSLIGSSSAISSLTPFHLTFEFGRSYKRPLPSLLASMASKEDHGTTLHKDNEEKSSSRNSRVPSLWKEGHGPNAVMQQVSSLRHFFMPELPFAIITEIKKRIPLSFREDDEEEMHMNSPDLSGGLIVEKALEEQLTVMGPRCMWPRSKLVSVEASRQAGTQARQGPRCAWPRGSPHTVQSLLQSKQEEDVLARNEEVASGAKCAWPKASSRTQHQTCSQEKANSSLMSAQEGNIVTAEDLDNLKGVSRRLEESNSHVIEGPRCAWPRSTPRRMLATGVGLGLINHLFIDQGAPALAILLQSPFPITCEDLSPHKSLLP